MCQRITCRRCGKPAYRGCGRHVEQALAGVPRSRRCTGAVVQHGGEATAIVRIVHISAAAIHRALVREPGPQEEQRLARRLATDFAG